MRLTFDNINGGSEVFLDVINAIVGPERKSMIDIGCNHAPFTCQLGFEERSYIDILPRELDNKNEQKYFRQMNALDIPLYEDYDVSFSNDVIEHLYFVDGLAMLKLMAKISKKQVLFTPLDEWMMTDELDKNPESHRSLFTPDILDRITPNHFAYVIFPHYHPTLNIGAFYFWYCADIEEDFERVKKEINQKAWAKH